MKSGFFFCPVVTRRELPVDENEPHLHCLLLVKRWHEVPCIYALLLNLLVFNEEGMHLSWRWNGYHVTYIPRVRLVEATLLLVLSRWSSPLAHSRSVLTLMLPRKLSSCRFTSTNGKFTAILTFDSHFTRNCCCC